MSEMNGFKDVSEKESNKFENCPLAKQAEICDNNTNKSKDYDAPIVNEKKEPIKNKQDGLAREKDVAKELKEQYPPEKGYSIVSEAYLRDKNGNIVKDPKTGEARRVDFMVVKNGKVVDSIEVTSKTAVKREQMEKENRIRKAGGNYIRDNNGNLVQIPDNVHTRIERRD